jgi:hypothetical protein
MDSTCKWGLCRFSVSPSLLFEYSSITFSCTTPDQILQRSSRGSASQATMQRFYSRLRARHFKPDYSNPVLFPQCCCLAPGILIDSSDIFLWITIAVSTNTILSPLSSCFSIYLLLLLCILYSRPSSLIPARFQM